MFRQLIIYAFLVLLGGVACRHEDVAPVGCQFVFQKTFATDLSTYTYRFDATNRLDQVFSNTGQNDVRFDYAYQDQEATIDVGYYGSDWLKIHYDVTLNEQGYALTAQATLSNRLADKTWESHLTASHTFSYDTEGHLTSHQVDQFSYPFKKPKTIETSRQDIEYTMGNPVSIAYGRIVDGLFQPSGTVSNRYGSQLNSIRIPLLLEIDQKFSLDNALQPLLGKSPVNLLFLSKEKTTQRTDSTRYVYQTNVQGQVTSAVQQPGTPNTYFYYSPAYSFKNSCL